MSARGALQMRRSKRAVAYAATTTGAAALNGVFQSLYVSMFLT